MQQTSAPPISVRANIWIVIPITALIAAILTANFLFLNYVHIFSSILWTGTDIFMAFLLGPILRNVSLSTRKEVTIQAALQFTIIFIMAEFETGFSLHL